jgi:hypothetical protein
VVETVRQHICEAHAADAFHFACDSPPLLPAVFLHNNDSCEFGKRSKPSRQREPAEIVIVMAD